MEVESNSEEETDEAVPTDLQHESDLRWKENLFYRGEAELTRRRVFSSNLMQLVYGSSEPVDEETDVAKEEEESDDARRACFNEKVRVHFLLEICALLAGYEEFVRRCACGG